MTMFSPFSDSDATKSPSAWKSAPLPDSTPGRRRNVQRLRAMGGDPMCVPPDFNSTMLSVWEELWHLMPQSGKVSVTVNSLLQHYKEYCTDERNRPRDASESPAALLPCCQFHLPRPRTGYSSSRRLNLKLSRQVQ